MNTQLKYKNTSGDTTIIYPITKGDNILGVLPTTSGGTGASNAAAARTNLGAAPMCTFGIYGTDDVVSGNESNKPDGTLHFSYDTEDDVRYYVKRVFVSIEGIWRLVVNNVPE